MDSIPDWSHAALPVPGAVRAAFGREWTRLSSPGASLTAQERLRVAQHARRATEDEPTAHDAPLDRAAHEVAHHAHRITAPWVDALHRDGLQGPQYVETLAIVSRLSAVDTWTRGFALPLIPLPQPQPGDAPPHAEIATEAVRSKAFVPIVGLPGALTALSLLPGENAAREDLHVPLYLSAEQMQDPTHCDVLTRAQIELTAARTSHLNDCRY